MQNIIFWFRNDLRLHDNEAFLQASKAGKVIPVYVFDDRYFEKNFLGFKRTGAFRTKFMLEAVEDLRKSLQEKGSELIVRTGLAEDIIAKMAEESEAAAVYASKEVTQDETTIEALLSKQLKPLNIEIELIWSATLFHARDLPFQINFLPPVFADFRKKIEQSAKVRKTFDNPGQLPAVEGIEPGDIPTLETLGFENTPVPDTRSAFNFKGGETSGLEHLNDYIWKNDLLKTYKKNQNSLTGVDSSSKLSAWLSLGCLSSRKIYEEVKRYETEVVANESTHALILDLLWRDYFHFSALKHGTRMFKASGIKNDLMKQWNRNRPVFDTWVNGETGTQLTDACMHELRLTGYLSNQCRQNVAVYLINELGIDWTWGAAYFESILVDYDVCNNWGNWNHLAGLNKEVTGSRESEKKPKPDLNEAEQEYIKLWLGKNARL